MHVPAERRPIGVVFQDYLLFPHLSVLENVAFGPRSCGEGRAAARRRAVDLLDRVGLADCAAASRAPSPAGRRSGSRSPGRSPPTRAAPARRAPRRDRRPHAAELRRGLRHHLAAFDGTFLVITHDPIEAMTLGRQLVVLEAGRVVQSGTPDELSSHPRSRFVAELLGLNLYLGRAEQRSIVLANGRRLIAADPVPQEGEVFAVIPPRAVALHRVAPEGSPRNVWQGTVGELDVAGDHVRVHVGGDLPVIAEVTPAAVAALRLGEGGPVFVAVKAVEVEVYAT